MPAKAIISGESVGSGPVLAFVLFWLVKSVVDVLVWLAVVSGVLPVPVSVLSLLRPRPLSPYKPCSRSPPLPSWLLVSFPQPI